MAETRFVFASAIRVHIAGGRATTRHFRHEYGPCAVDDAGTPAVDIVFDAPPSSVPGRSSIRGGHKSVSWRIDLGDPGSDPLRAAVTLAGWPGGIARSLVQGYFVEPLISIAAARRGLVLLPSAGIVGRDGLVVIMGRARAGKSTLAARLMAAGRHVLGDDQLLVDGAGRCFPFPRRLRFYPDLAQAAPLAHARLRPGTRRALRSRAALSTMTRGYVRPSLAVDRIELGGSWHPGPVPVSRIVLLERSHEGEALRPVPADVATAVGWTARLLEEQRARLADGAGGAWAPSLDAIRRRESEIMTRAIGGVPIESIAIPRHWSAANSVGALARHLGFEP